jgi:hypothetical protein
VRPLFLVLLLVLLPTMAAKIPSFSIDVDPLLACCRRLSNRLDEVRTLGFVLLIALYMAGLFVACMFCHGEMARLKPDPRYLTRFYLMMSVGGATGAVLVAIAAPLLLAATSS